jgi:hypothetical protein
VWERKACKTQEQKKNAQEKLAHVIPVLMMKSLTNRNAVCRSEATGFPGGLQKRLFSKESEMLLISCYAFLRFVRTNIKNGA